MEQQQQISRRTLLKLMGACGASSAVTSVLAWGTPTHADDDVSKNGVHSFEIHISDDELEDLRRRLSMTRWPPRSPDKPWALGSDLAKLEEMIAYWRDKIDWRKHEAELNKFAHFTTTIDGQRIHFVHHKGKSESSLPLLMTHGWPGTFWEMLPSVRGLADPVSHGGNAADSFDVVVPSIPGFGFSGEPQKGTDMGRTAELWIGLMDRLGYKHFGAYGSDWGAGVTRELGAGLPDRVVGIHTPGAPPREQREPKTAEEREYLARMERWSVDETGYQRIQGTKPQTLAYGLTDSPIGLTAWIIEKLRSWSDCNGDVEKRFSKDQILTLVSIYWHTRTAGTSVRYYYANGYWRTGKRNRSSGPVRVPRGYAQFVGIPARSDPPKSFIGELPDNVTHLSVFDKGGHFPAIEEPELLVGDLRKFFRPLRSE